MKKYFILLIVIIFTGGCAKQTADAHIITPPSAKKIHTETVLMDNVLIDDYAYMRNLDDYVLQYIEAENAYTDEKLRDVRDDEDSLYNEMIGRIRENDMSVPYVIGNYQYYSKSIEGEQYSVYCRKLIDSNEEIVVLDINKMAQGYSYYNIANIRISPDENFLLFLVDTSGNESYTLNVKDIELNNICPENLNNISQAEWADDNKTIIYTVENTTKRPFRVMKHVVGRNIEEDIEMFRDDDEKYWVWIDKSRDNKYIFAGSSSKTTSYMLFLECNSVNDTFTVLFPKKQNVEYYVSHNNGYFYILTNFEAYNFKVQRMKIDEGKNEIEDFIIERDGVTINSMDMFKDFIVLNERKSGNQAIEIFDLHTGNSHYIEFPERSFSIWYEKNPEFETERFRLSYSSFITPATVYEYNMKERQLTILKEYKLECEYDKDKYETKVVNAIGRDGTLIPISMVYRKGLKFSEKTPLVLNGYGAYGMSSDPYFSSVRLSLLDRGIVYAIAHIRGGGENGRRWYEDGKMLNKKNTFYDFIDCADFLVNKNYTSSAKMIGTGGSAGGLLIGAVINMRPDLFKAVIAGVPFIDLMNTMLDETIPLTTAEYEEWGNPSQPEYFEYMLSYSPYDNIIKQSYPNTLITAGLNDARVAFWEPLKWIAKLRVMNTGSSELMLKMNTAGHGGASGRYDFYREIAFEYSFILKMFNMDK